MLMEQLMLRLPSEWRRTLDSSPIWKLVAEATTARGDGTTSVGPKTAVADAYALLPKYAAEVLDVMLLHTGPAPIEEEKLVSGLRMQARLAGAQIRTGLARLGEAGLAFAIRRAWGERWWVIPSDLYVLLMNHIYPYECGEEQLRNASEVLPLMDANGQFLSSPVPFERTFMYGLSYIARSDAALTSKGLLPKKMIDRLAAMFQPIEASLAPFGLQTAHAGQYPLGVALFLEAAYALELIELRDRRLVLLQPQLQRWLHEPRRSRQLQDWLVSRLTEVAGADSAACADILGQRGGEAADGSWRVEHVLLAAEDKRLSLRDAARRSADWRMQSRWPGLWLDVFHSFGWLELGQPIDSVDGSERLFRWRMTPVEQKAELMIQPSGELIAGPGCGYACRWELELIAERRSDEEWTQYDLTAHSIASAFELGRTQSSIVQFLLAAADTDRLPPSLETMLEQWASSACQFDFVQATLLRCSSPERAEWLAGQPQAAPYILERVGPALFVVEEKQVSTLRKLLQQAGFSPRKGIAPSWINEEAEESAVGGYPEIPLHAYPAFVPVDDELAEAEGDGRLETERRSLPIFQGQEGIFLSDPALLRRCELASEPAPDRLQSADWESVPHMWSKQLREYHLSTRKELLQRAISLETSVRMRTGGEWRIFIPDRLEQRGSDWAVTGIWGDRDAVQSAEPGAEHAEESVRLTPDMWDEMGIALPDGLPT